MTNTTPLNPNSPDRDVVVRPLGPPLTLADVLTCIEADPALSLRSRRDMAKALHI